MGRVTVPVTVRWSDMDAYGHVNNVQFLRLLEEVRVRAFEALRGAGPGLLQTGTVVAHQEVEYLAPLTWRLAPVDVELWVTHIGGASFDLGYEVFDEEPAAAGEGDQGLDGTGGRAPLARRTYLRASTTAVAFDGAAQRPRRLTDGEREVLESWRDGPVPFRRRRQR